MQNQYMEPTDLYQNALKRYKEILNAKQMLEKRRARYPQGRVYTIKNKNTIQYYVRQTSKDKCGKYLSKRNKQQLQLYLQKRYDEDVLKLLNQEANLISSFLKRSKNFSQQIRAHYSTIPEEVKELIIPLDVSDEDYAKMWESEVYERKAMSEDVPEYISDKGDRVRSKSELNIANLLYKYGIPYKYECPLILESGKKIYPDFTVLNAASRKVIYWEHRGMMEDDQYARHAVGRLKDYANSGLFLGDNLIITEESLSNPLGTNDIQKVIKFYFM